MYAIVAGGGKVGFFLARESARTILSVLDLENNAERAEFIANELGNVVLRGNADEASTLAEAGAERADVVIAVTGDEDRHLRDKILNVLFTAPGERVGNPGFGAGIDRMVFEPLDELILTATEFRIGEGLRRELGGEASFGAIELSNPDDGQLLITIEYQRRDPTRRGSRRWSGGPGAEG